jgi:nitrate reductase molybdenum cofactor assembly chaperone NarJ/NarW
MVTTTAEVLAAFARLFEYPGPDLAARAAAAKLLLAPPRGDAERRIEEFAAWAAATARGRVEETYTAALDLDAACSPYVGQRLLGNDPRRGVFMARLAARYRARGFSAGCELPDHLAVMLRFVSQAPDEPDLGELVEDCIAPAVASLARELARRGHPYAPLAQALELVIAASNTAKEAQR